MSPAEAAWQEFQRERGYGRNNPPHPLFVAGYRRALEDAADAIHRANQAKRGTPEFDLWISDMTEADIAAWLRARAALAEETAERDD